MGKASPCRRRAILSMPGLGKQGEKSMKKLRKIDSACLDADNNFRRED